LKLHGNTREHAKCHFGIGTDENEGVKGREKCEEEAEGRGNPKPSHLFERRKKRFFIFSFEGC
jgi:hypothetical protein